MKIIAIAGPLAYAYDDDSGQYHFLTDYQPTESGCTYVISSTSANPLLVWTLYWQMADCYMRRRIGAALEKQGMSPYTGEPNKNAAEGSEKVNED
ncbi:hypothetical protein SAMN05192585_11229 [Acetanaerobacterium elongatum]|uniref:Uncharacterized protein n=1 Tax=Acetanaerobacterium elongatum TaxID=258515 RepID=A0A1G9YYN8_9FIRM|nr:hypothetical protein SAMN05192585_11229 [Acetanaerobacterium elongatum]